jgi:hypothetical protein
MNGVKLNGLVLIRPSLEREVCAETCFGAVSFVGTVSLPVAIGFGRAGMACVPEKEYAADRLKRASTTQKAVLFAYLGKCNLISLFVWSYSRIAFPFFACYTFKYSLNLEDKPDHNAW